MPPPPPLSAARAGSPGTWPVRRKATPAVDVSRLAGQCQIVAQAGRIAAWVGDGRAVTAKGVPRRSDLSAVASALYVEIPGHVLRPAPANAIPPPSMVATTPTTSTPSPVSP